MPAGAYLRFATLSVRVSQRAGGRDARPGVRAEPTLERGRGDLEPGQRRVAWCAPGAEGVPADRSEQLGDARTIYPTTLITDRYGFDVTALVAGWLAAPDTNQGFLLRSDPVDRIDAQ